MASRGFNQQILVGNLTKDPELKTTASGKKVCHFSIAENRSWKDKDGNTKTETNYHNIACWGKMAEIYSQYLKKGSKVLIVGRTENQKYTKDNITYNYTQVIASTITMLNKKPVDETEDETPTEIENIETESDETEPIPF